MAFQINTGHTGYASIESPNPQLLLTDCVGCHAAFDGYTWKDSVTGAPIVYNTGAPATYLAGGNFYWVANGADAKGHNVFVSNPDGTLNIAPGDSGHAGMCNDCHGSLATADSGCEGCHREPAHHADDGTGTKYVGTADAGWYRFLSGHADGSGVAGIEHSGWGPSNGTVGGTNHNEYLGVPEAKTGYTSLTNKSMTAFCCGCHGNFHVEQDSSGNWIRHPSNFIIPNSGEYSNAFSAESGIGIYDPCSPVARPSGFAGFNTGDPSGIVYLGIDMVMCLTCHRAHGSPYYKILRWNYKSMILSDALYGCSKCHTSKN